MYEENEYNEFYKEIMLKEIEKNEKRMQEEYEKFEEKDLNTRLSIHNSFINFEIPDLSHFIFRDFLYTLNQ